MKLKVSKPLKTVLFAGLFSLLLGCGDYQTNSQSGSKDDSEVNAAGYFYLQGYRCSQASVYCYKRLSPTGGPDVGGTCIRTPTPPPRLVPLCPWLPDTFY